MTEQTGFMAESTTTSAESSRPSEEEEGRVRKWWTRQERIRDIRQFLPSRVGRCHRLDPGRFGFGREKALVKEEATQNE